MLNLLLRYIEIYKIFLAIIDYVVIAFEHFVTARKPGVCPVNTDFTTCEIRADQCASDSDCVGNRKCCSDGCGRTCLRRRRGKLGDFLVQMCQGLSSVAKSRTAR